MSASSEAKQPFHIAAFSYWQSVLILGAAAMLLSVVMGIRQSYGLFQTPVVKDLGIATADFALSIAIQNLVWGLAGPVAGAMIDRWGTRWVALGGSLLFMAGLAVTATATTSWMIMLGSGLMMGTAQSATTVGMAAKIAAQVVTPARRSLAFGVVSAAGSIGTFFVAPLGQHVIGAWGWRAGFLAFLAIAVLMLPAALIGGTVDKLRTTGRGGSGQSLSSALTEAAGHRGYVVMSLAYFVCGLQLTFLTTHLPSYLSLCGQDPMLGAQALAVVGLFNVFGSWLFGWLGDIYRKRTLLGMVYVLRSLIIAVYFVLPVTPASTLIFAALMGLLWLSVIPLVNGLLVDIFGVRYLSTLQGFAFLSHQVGSFLGAWGGGAIYDALGSYDRALQAGILIGLIAGCAQLLMYDRPTARMNQAKVAPAE